jgi:hypothetical protein
MPIGAPVPITWPTRTGDDLRIELAVFAAVKISGSELMRAAPPNYSLPVFLNVPMLIIKSGIFLIKTWGVYDFHANNPGIVFCVAAFIGAHLHSCFCHTITF